MPWRTGRKVGRTIYLQKEWQPSDGDQLIGVMDTKELSDRIVRLINLQDEMPDVIQSLLDLHPVSDDLHKRLG